MKYIPQHRKNLLENESIFTASENSKKANTTIFSSIKPRIFSAYGTYDALVTAINNPLPASTLNNANPNIETEEKNTIIDHYEHPPSTLKSKIKELRENHGLTDCPYCGNPVTPDTLDHFIPKDDLPEFSIFINNLMPQCRECAPTKGTQYYCTSKGMVKFIHPAYFDLLSMVRFKVDSSIDSNKIIKFVSSYEILSSVNIDDRQRIDLHFLKLKIIERMGIYCQRSLISWQNKLRTKRFDIRAALQQRLSEISSPDSHGNDWKAALYISLLSNNQIINYLHSLRPSD